MKEFKESHLATAIICWLNYVSALGRNYILAESSIKIPASEYLEVNHIQPNLETDHPKFKPVRKIDLQFKYKSIDIAYEFKFVKGDSTRDPSERIRVFNDIMRLHLFQETNKHKGFFLICGITDEFKMSFENLDLNKDLRFKEGRRPDDNTESFYSEWFSFDVKSPQKEIDTTNTDELYEVVYTAFKGEYEKPFKDKTNDDLKLPDKIKTKLVFLSKENKVDEVPDDFKIGIWEILKN
ncbi:MULTISPECIES: hypothetical protein [Flavobacteriaceae]|uniref:hypothetical protein n=1 Tax=Flavobacteriaceae TaxID=49546 RepID=UPI003A8E2253